MHSKVAILDFQTLDCGACELERLEEKYNVQYEHKHIDAEDGPREECCEHLPTCDKAWRNYRNGEGE